MTESNAYWLNLSNGRQIRILETQLFGADSNNLSTDPIQAELVFQTGMTGYIESFTDPSYAGQIMVCTYPHQGNYGVPDQLFKNGESDHIWPKVIIMADYVDDASHYAAHQTLSSWFAEHKIIGITGIDTRLLTQEIRNNNLPLYAVLTGNYSTMPCHKSINQTNHLALVNSVARHIPVREKTEKSMMGPEKQLLFIDMGAKNSQITRLSRCYTLDIVPYNHDFESVDLSKYSGIFLSNGPGNPKSAM